MNDLALVFYCWRMSWRKSRNRASLLNLHAARESFGHERRRKEEKWRFESKEFIDRPADRLAPGRLASANASRGRLFASQFSPMLISPSLLFSSSSSFSPFPLQSVDERFVHLLVMVWILPDRSTGRRTGHLEFDQKYLSWRLLLSSIPGPTSPSSSVSFAAPHASPKAL